jgi:1,4-dihydroxy-2-naphthoate octaprenyltransferase
VGPVRLVASGLAAPAAVKRAALVAFGIAGLAGLALSIVAGPELLVVGAASMAAGWFYTGGPRPYGYAGLGEVFVFVFFGIVATVGSAYVQTGGFHQLEFAVAVPVGLLAVALLVINNLRDIPGDRVAGKRTVAVRVGDHHTRTIYVGCLAVAFASALAVGADRPGALLAALALPLAVPPLRKVTSGASGRELIAVLGETGRLQLLVGVLLTAGLALGAR